MERLYYERVASHFGRPLYWRCFSKMNASPEPADSCIRGPEKIQETGALEHRGKQAIRGC
jgi:hypothetical protein